MSHFEVSRSVRIQADPARVHALIDDFHEWTAWSPWEDIDPELQRTYTGPPAGVGAHYAWQGNRKAGAGSMEITSSSPTEVGILLSFLKVFTMDKLVGKDFEKGLARLRAVAETPA